MTPQKQELNASKNFTNAVRTKRGTLDGGEVRNGRNTTAKPNVTNEANCFLFIFVLNPELPYFGYVRIQFFFELNLSMQEQRSKASVGY